MDYTKRVVARITDKFTGEWSEEEFICGSNRKGLYIRYGYGKYRQLMKPNNFTNETGDEIFRAIDFLYPESSWIVDVATDKMKPIQQNMRCANV